MTLPYVSETWRHPYGSWGNGSAMRCSAVGWFFDTLEETEKVAEISAAITHNHPEGIKGAQATAAAVWMARSGKSKEEIRDYVESRFGYDLHRTYDEVFRVYQWDDSCQGTVPEAMIAFLESADFEDALRKAVSLGGDSDTLTCICCSIAEAYYRDIPESEIILVALLHDIGKGHSKEFSAFSGHHPERPAKIVRRYLRHISPEVLNAIRYHQHHCPGHPLQNLVCDADHSDASKCNHVVPFFKSL